MKRIKHFNKAETTQQSNTLSEKELRRNNQNYKIALACIAKSRRSIMARRAGHE